MNRLGTSGMITGKKPQTIGDLQDRRLRPPFATNTLAPSRFGFLGTFDHIREVCQTFFLAKDMPCCAVALGIPAYTDGGKVVIDFPVFEVERTLTQDRVAQANLQDSNRGSLQADPFACTVGAVLKYFEAGPDAFNTKTKKKLYEHLTRQIAVSRQKRWVELPDPANIPGGAFKQSFKEETKCNCVYPFVLDGRHIFGVFGIDLRKDFVENQETRLLLLLDTFERLLTGLYGAYYSHLDAPSNEVAMAYANCVKWEWESATRVLGRAYLEELRRETAKKGKCPLGDSKHCVILYGDGNGIKQLNDTHGHETGNEVIRALGGVLWQSCRAACSESDLCEDAVVVRWGGDEFIVVMAVKTLRNVERAVRILKTQIENHLNAAVAALEDVLRNATKRDISLRECVGISIGWSRWGDKKSKDFRKAEISAEKAMYISKITGKLFDELSRKKLVTGKARNIWVMSDKEAKARGGLLRKLTGARLR